MKLQQSLWIHGVALVLASGLAWQTWTDEEAPTTLTRDRVQVWSANVDQLESMRFESEKRTVDVLVHEDENGRWYEVRVDREVPGKTPRTHHGPHGAGGAPPAEPAAERKKQAFVSVTEGNELAESLAPLMALRAVGRIEGEREKEFGFDQSPGKLVVRIAGKQHTLVLGGVTPGGADRYARVQETGEVFAVPGDLVRRFEQAENRLFERQLQSFGEQEPDRVRIVQGDRSRELVAVEGKLGGWADPSAPKEQDETASNWMGKLGKLRAMSYLEGPKAIEGQKPLLAVEYFRGGKQVGRLELFQSPEETPAPGPATTTAAAKSGRTTYVARSQHVRWPVEVSATAAEVEQDLPSLFQ